MTNQISQENEVNKADPLPKIIFGVVGVFVIICGAIVLGTLYYFGRFYFESKTQIILEPDYSQISTVSPSDLKTAAKVLNARCLSLKCGASFVVAENNQILVQAPNSIDAQNFINGITKIGLIEFVDFGETPISSGSKIATDFEYEYLPQVAGKKWHTLMTNSEFDSGNAETDVFGQYQIRFTLNSNGTKILSDYTTENIDHYLGIVLDKVVLSSPTINEPIIDGAGKIPGNFSQEDAELLAAYLIANNPLPMPLKVK